MSNTQPPFQLTSLIDLQTDYLNTLPTGASSNQLYVDLQSNLNNLNTRATNANNVLSSELGNLSEVDTLLTEEKQDLDIKKQQVDGAHFAKMRELSFMDSRRKRQSELTNMYYILFVALLIFIGIVILNRFFELSDGLLTIFALIIFSTAGLLMTNKYLQIRKRDKGDYDKLSLTPPVPPYLTESEIQASAVRAANLAALTENDRCGRSTCGEGTQWDVARAACVPTPVTTPTTPPTSGPVTTPTTSGPVSNPVSAFTTIEDTKYVYDVKPFESSKKSSFTPFS
jgi:hypothetical protein